jgi:hypothetical protein
MQLLAGQHDPDTPMPSFMDTVGNITVIKGRDITFTCIVKHLGKYKVSLKHHRHQRQGYPLHLIWRIADTSTDGCEVE